MSPSHTILSRAPTAEERKFIARNVKPDLASYGCITLALGVAPIVLLTIFGGWLAGWFSPERVTLGRAAGAVIGLGIFLYAVLSFRAYERRLRRRAARDLDEMAVQEITVRDPRVVEIGLISDNAPILAFAIGEGKLLFLQGQWLVNHAIYDAPPLDGDPDEQYLNGFPPPYSFPSSTFVLVRLAHSGRVLRLRVAGNYVRPETEVEALRPEYEFGDSEIFSGELDQVAAVLAREHAARISYSHRPGH